ncbi:MAG: ABC transporter, partial [Nitrosopumilaceae archaeon]|nr:ABC transporter [Nitrosopumilaceae archaeon]
LPKYDSVLVVAGPKKTLLQTEIDAIKNFIDEGGNTIFMLEPQGSPELVKMLSGYGIKIGNNIVIDPS